MGKGVMGKTIANVMGVIVLKDELETAMRLVGITNLTQAHRGLVHTGAIDHLVPDTMDEHPYAKWRVKGKL